VEEVFQSLGIGTGNQQSRRRGVRIGVIQLGKYRKKQAKEETGDRR